MAQSSTWRFPPGGHGGRHSQVAGDFSNDDADPGSREFPCKPPRQVGNRLRIDDREQLTVRIRTLNVRDVTGGAGPDRVTPMVRITVRARRQVSRGGTTR